MNKNEYGTLFFLPALPALRIRGSYFALLTLAFVELIYQLLQVIRPNLTGGTRGMSGIQTLTRGAVNGYYMSLMSVRDNLLVGAYTARGDIARNLDVVHKLFPRLEERENQETSTQSGGQRQMVSIGRALMSSPRLLLVNEPTLGLAPKICLEIAEVLRRLCREFGTMIVITEQNANFAMTLAERLYVLESGEIRATGTVDELRNDPRLTEAYFGS